MAASANKHTHTLPQCSPASVGLTQARPNYNEKQIFHLKHNSNPNRGGSKGCSHYIENDSGQWKLLENKATPTTQCGSLAVECVWENSN